MSGPYVVTSDDTRRRHPSVAEFTELRHAIAAAAIRLAMGDVTATSVTDAEGKVWWTTAAAPAAPQQQGGATAA